jgi:hypothetical protein
MALNIEALMANKDAQNDPWVLMIPPLQRILSDLEFDDRREAVERAREENRVGIYKGRGVKAVRLSYLKGKGESKVSFNPIAGSIPSTKWVEPDSELAKLAPPRGETKAKRLIKMFRQAEKSY